MNPRTTPRVHLKRDDWRREHRAACGLHNPQRYTADPDDVTCGACIRSVQMFDALIRSNRNSQ